MRVISGLYRGRTLAEFKGEEIRPTSDFARESLFNIIRLKVNGATFLDLFCGTGAVGIEALSNGAKKVVFNDIAKKSVELTQFNLNNLKINGSYEIKNFDALTLIKTIGIKFDIIFLDAPYKDEVEINSLNICADILNDDGIVVYENEKAAPIETNFLVKYDERKYGRAILSFFRRKK